VLLKAVVLLWSAKVTVGRVAAAGGVVSERNEAAGRVVVAIVTRERSSTSGRVVVAGGVVNERLGRWPCAVSFS